VIPTPSGEKMSLLAPLDEKMTVFLTQLS